uniref:Phosphomannomutase n=1 Tax=Myxobolus squamalis TaxID=59785 RepID=A0A6B2G0K9_MYXSQ
MSSGSNKPLLLLFDMDGTLTPPRQPMSEDMKAIVCASSGKNCVGIVTGSDFVKIMEQLNSDIDFFKKIDYIFPENGVLGFKKGVQFTSRSISEELGEELLKNVINYCLRYIADLDLPVKRGTFIEFRKSMINVCPIGRNCSKGERELFMQLDLSNGIRQKLVECLEREFGTEQLKFSIGGQISVDIFPIGWDKSYCLNHIDRNMYEAIHFFGDKTLPVNYVQ